MYYINNSYDYGKLVYIYDLDKHELIKNVDKNENLLQNPKYVLCFKIENINDFIHINNNNLIYDIFPWETYYKLNADLLSNNKSYNIKIRAWNHWINYGKKEERSISYINNTNYHLARFGNLFFLNMCLNLFSLKYNLKSSYKYEKEFNQLGIYFHKGSKIYNKNLLLTDSNFENLLESDVSPKNIIINNNVWFHRDRFCKIIKEYFSKNNIFEIVKNHNKYKNRYENNNDVFIHVRLGDVTDRTDNLLDYYIKVINSIEFSNGYITSDNINHELCKILIKKYNLHIINKSEVETIMFGSTCKNIILSGGTFSWLIGFLAQDKSTIFYPEITKPWYGNIFRFSNWINQSL
jgi:hypothetical protein